MFLRFAGCNLWSGREEDRAGAACRFCDTARRLAEDIVASQRVEIEAMKRRLAVPRGEAKTQEDDYPALGGTRGPQR